MGRDSDCSAYYSSALISWTTDQPADSLVSYGTASGNYTASTTLADTSPLVRFHSVGLTGLNASTQYYYVMTSNDGSATTSSENTFTTGAARGGASYGAASAAEVSLLFPLLFRRFPPLQPPGNSSLPFQAGYLPTTSATVKLINNQGTYYLEQDGVLHGITNPGMRASYGFTFADAQTTTGQDLSLPQGTLLSPNDGSLVRSTQDPTVYLISGNQRFAFTSARVFTALGYKFSSVLVITNPELQALARAVDISGSSRAHLDGSDIEIDGTIYWIDHQTRFPYPSLAVYNSWHKTSDFATVVPANSADLKLPVGGPVVPREINGGSSGTASGR